MEFVVRMQETVEVEYTVEAYDEAAARAEALRPTKPRKDRQEMETTDWELLSICTVDEWQERFLSPFKK